MRRLGVNLLYLLPQQVGGTETFARRLIAALAAERPELEIVCFCGREAGAVLPDPSWPGSVRVETLPVDSANKPARLATELLRLPRAAARTGVDLLHSFGTTTPFHSRMPRVTTVHDIIYHHYPGAFPAPARLGLKLVVPPGARRSHRVQVSSHATKDEVVEVLRLRPETIDVVPLGLGMRDVPDPTPEAELRERHALGAAPVLLSIAAALPHKNLERLLHAFAQQDPGTLLVLTGHAGRVTDTLKALAGTLGIADRVRFTGWLTDQEVEGLYRLATAFAYPSLHEGFGLPVLEAMHRGVPVVCANATSLPEVAGDAARLVDGRDTQALAAALRDVLTDPELRADLAARGPARAAQFGWDRTARAALDSYALALSSSAARRSP